MGCGNPREKVENEIIKMKMQRIIIQMERKNQLQLLKDIDGKELKIQKILDYIDKSCESIDTKRNKKTEPDSVKKHSRIRKNKTISPLKRRKMKEETFETLKNEKHLRRKKTCKV